MELTSWHNGKTKNDILSFVNKITNKDSPDFIPPEARVAVFDNDGTLWCEKPLPIQADFLLRKIAEMAAKDPSLKSLQPWKAVVEKDYKWLNGVITKHYHGDDSDLKEMSKGLLEAFEGTTIEEFAIKAERFLKNEMHPHFQRPYYECVYRPMVELLRFLEAHGFTNYIASGGGRDFVRTVSEEIYEVPAERIIGSSVALTYKEIDGVGNIIHMPSMDVFDDGAVKPVRIWSRIGRRPILTVGNSNGDIPMFKFCEGNKYPSLVLLLNHDDDKREYSYYQGAEDSLLEAKKRGWTTISMKKDWQTVFFNVFHGEEKKAA